MTPPIQTDRLVLRRMVGTDADHLLAYWTHPEVLRAVPGEPMSRERAIKYIAKQCGEEVGDGGGYFALAVHHQKDNQMIGEVGLFIQPKEQSSGDIGWMIHPDWQRRGYATEAAKAMLAYGFTTRGLHRISSGCDASNFGSLRVMKRLGMRSEAHFLKSRFIAGRWQDAYAYAILKEEWAAAWSVV